MNLHSSTVTSVTTRDAAGRTALHCGTCLDPRSEVATALAQRGGVLKAMALLVECGARLERRNAYGRCPLHAAARAHRGPEMVAELLAADSSVEGCDFLGRTALHQCEAAGIHPLAWCWSGLNEEYRMQVSCCPRVVYRFSQTLRFLTCQIRSGGID